MRIREAVAAVAAMAGLFGAGQANAGLNTASGVNAGVSWQASSRIVGVDSTATVVGGGNPIYLAQSPEYRGVVGLLIDYGADGAFVCSGSLASDRQSIVTAGHCVSGGGGVADAGIQSVTAFFYDGNPTDPVVYNGGPGVTTVDVTDIYVNPEYTGEVIDQNDISVLRLAELAPSFATAYELYTPADLTGTRFNVAGYGTRSDGGGNVGGNLGTGRLRQGDNIYDFALGDDAFNGFFTSTDPDDPSCGPTDNYFCGSADIEFSYVSDFDNGLAANDASCLVAGLAGAAGQFCQLGLGVIEVGIDGGDSGGPQFVNGQLAGVNSYGLSFGSRYGDIDGALNASFGEFSGYVPTYIHADWINSVLVQDAAVPEPASWAMMIAGFGLVGGALRRRQGVRAIA
jgi:hypothetical protein